MFWLIVALASHSIIVCDKNDDFKRKMRILWYLLWQKHVCINGVCVCFHFQLDEILKKEYGRECALIHRENARTVFMLLVMPTICWAVKTDLVLFNLPDSIFSCNSRSLSPPWVSVCVCVLPFRQKEEAISVSFQMLSNRKLRFCHH